MTEKAALLLIIASLFFLAGALVIDEKRVSAVHVEGE